METTLQDLNDAMASVVERVESSLVQVHSGRNGAGAGTVWHPDGLIVTNAHVTRRGPMTITLADGRTLPAKLLAQDRVRDLAALMVDASGLPAVELGDSHGTRPGQWVLAMGHPWGVRGAVTAGVAIGTSRAWPGMPSTGGEWIGVNLALRPGNSGGPLLDVSGRLLGINTAVIGPEVGLAVPVHVAKEFLRESLGPR